MNTPSRTDGNWRWRYQPGALTKEVRDALAKLAQVTDRLVQKPSEKPTQNIAEHFAA
jgi:4-alpha-glucanotransferase